MYWAKLRPLLVIAACVLGLFGPALVRDRSFAMRDSAHFYQPLFQWTTSEWAKGRVPLWNPYENCGTPVLADATSSVFYPGKLLFALPLDFTLLYKLYIVLHLALAAGGAYALARAWDRTSSAAALAGLAYACGGSVVFQYCNLVFLVSAAWLPLSILAIDRLLTLPSWPALILAAVSWALMILGGDPQAALHAVLVAGLYAGLLAYRERRAALLAHRFMIVGLGVAVAAALAAVQLVPSMEATRLSERAAYNRPRNVYEAARVGLDSEANEQPFGETPRESIVRGLFCVPEAGSHHERVYDFSVGPWRLLEFVWPNIGGRMFPLNRRWMSLIPAEGRVWSPTLYMGLLPIVCALGAMRISGGSVRVRWLGWMALVFTVGSFGYYGLGWLMQELHLLPPADDAGSIAPQAGGLYWLLVTLLPTYVYFRYPAKLLTVACLAISQLAAVGMDRLFEAHRPRIFRALCALGGVSLVGAFLAWLLGGLVLTAVTARDSTLGPFDAIGAQRDVILALIHTGAVGGLTAWFLASAWKRPSRLEQWRWTAVVFTAIELTAANSWLVATAPADVWREPSPVAASIHRELPAETVEIPVRLFRGNLASWRPESFAKGPSADRLVELTRWERDTLFPKHELVSRLSLVEAYGSIKLLDYESLLYVAKEHGPRQPDRSMLPQPTALRLLGTQYLLLPDRHQPGFAERIDVKPSEWPESSALWKMQRTLPRAWIVHDVVTLPALKSPQRVQAVDNRSREVLFPGLKARDFSQTAVVEMDGLLEPHDDTQGEDISASQDRAQIVHYDPRRVVIEASLTGAGLVVLSDSWYPGWRAFVTSRGATREVAIHRTNRVFRGVWLPGGQHCIEHRFEPRYFKVGAVVSVISWLVVVGFALWRPWSRREDQASTGHLQLKRNESNYGASSSFVPLRNHPPCDYLP